MMQKIHMTRRIISFIIVLLLTFSIFHSYGLVPNDPYLLLASITTKNAQTLNASAIVGNYNTGDFALSSTKLIVQGNFQTEIFPKNLTSIGVSSATQEGAPIFLSDLRNQTIYSFLSSSGASLSSPGIISSLRKVSINGQVITNGNIITLSAHISVGLGSAFFSSLDHIVVVDGDSFTVSQINLHTGAVTQLGSCLLRWQPSNAWYSIGIAEYFSQRITALVYGSVDGVIERQYISDDPDLEIVSDLLFDQLSALTVDVNSGLWYFYYNGGGPFPANYTSTVGYAAASFSEILPTSQPSGQPTSNPTFVVAAPKFVSIVVTPGRTTATLAIQIDDRSDYSGTVYCAAFTNITAIYSSSQIDVKGFSYSYAAHQTSMTITIPNLIPITTYASYCSIATFNGYTSTTTDIASSKEVFTTQCCKLLSFTNAPVNIYSDPTKYLNQPSTYYTYLYSLSNLPSSRVIITPTLISTSGGSIVPSSIVKITPASVTFTASSLVSTGYFILAPVSTSFSGSYQVVLNVSGTSATEYSPISTVMSFLSSTSIPSPPKLIGALFGDGGGDLYITFDSSTNLGGFTFGQQWLCGSLFNFPGANFTQCYWLNTTAVHGVFQTVKNSSVLINIGNTVQLLPSVLKAQCSSSLSAAACSSFNYSLPLSVTMNAPYHPVSPKVILTMPPSVGSCDNVTIDTTLSSGNGGRSWSKVKWTVSALSGTGNVNSILASLNYYGLNVLRTFIIQRSYFGSGTYSISLTLTNFLGVSSTASGVINAINNPNIPQVNILGGSSITTYSNLALTIYSSVSFASCVDTSNTKMLYSWKLFQNGQLQNIPAVSRDPSIYQLNAYTLTAGLVYQLSLNATAQVSGKVGGFATSIQSITVAYGIVQAVIKGGNSREVPTDQNITLDGSNSYDQDVVSNSGLSFHWTCSISSFIGFDQQCNYIIYSSKSNPQYATIIGSAMTLNYTYAVTLSVQSSDGRLSSTAVTVVPLAAGSATTSIASSRTTFNTNENFTLDGEIQSNYAVTASWNATVNEQSFIFSAYSPLQISLPESYVQNVFKYSLVVAANSFSAGTSVTFRITATPYGEFIVGSPSSSQIVLVANGAPHNGELVTTPMVGYGLKTNFVLQSLGWVDEPSDYPLTNTFSYSVGGGAPPSTIQAKTQLTSVTSSFPAGLQSNDYNISLQVVVTDAYNAEAVSTLIVTVYPNTAVNVTNYLSSNLQSAFASSNSHVALLTVNNAASTFNVVNCSAVNATFCAQLHRANCAGTINTCGSCLSGYKGTSGDANTKCFLANSTHGEAGSSCEVNDDCLYGNCTANVCRTPILSCPTAVPGSVCSGNGDCVYLNPSGVFYDSPCLITNVYCTAECICLDDYGGSDCSLDPSSAAERDANRATLCESIIKVTNFSNPSPKLIDSLVSSLYQSYSPSEVTQASTQALCEEALNILTYLIEEGYLAGTASITTNYIIALTSNFVQGSTNSSNSTIGDTVTSVTNGVFMTLKNGQSPIEVASDNVRISVRKDFLLDLENAVLSPPPTAAESAYQVPASQFQIVGDAAALACNSEGGYAHSSTMQWGKNPYANSSQVQSPLLRFQGNFKKPSESVQQLLENTTYYITLQFVAKQDFNRSIINYDLTHPQNPNAPKGNETFPRCSIYDGQEYVSCGNCSVSTYTDYNVTFVCKDISKLCKSRDSSSSSSSVVSDQAWERYTSRIYQSSIHENGIRRSLGADDDLFSDDSTTAGNGMSVQQYGALLEAVGTTFVSVLSANPFNVDIEQAKTIIAFVGSLFIVFIIGIIGFSSWDSYDRNQLLYANHWPPKQGDFIVNKLKRKIKKKKFNIEDLNRNPNQINIEEILTKDSVKYDDARIAKKLKKFSIPSTPLSIKSIPSPTASSDKTSSSTPKSGGGKNSHPSKSRNLVFSANISDFFDLVIPEIFEQANYLTLLKAIALRHDYITIFFRASAETNRFIRWIDLFNGILSSVFVSTLFFQIFYSNTGVCESYLTAEQCLHPLNSITGQTQCQWKHSDNANDDFTSNTDGSCELNTPPNNISFVVILALTCTMIGLPLQLLVSFILDVFCRKRPILEQFGLSTTYWFGHGINTSQIDYEDNERISQLQRNFQDAEEYYSKNPQSKLPYNQYYKPIPTVMTHSVEMALYNAQTIEEEMQDICVNVQKHYYRNNFITTNLTKLQLDAWTETFSAKTKAIIKYFGINPDGTFHALSLFDSFFYRSSQHKLEKTIRLARRKAETVAEELEELGPISQQLREVILLYYFVLEQFPPFKRWILEIELLCFQGFVPSKIDAWQWFLAWGFIWGLFGFYFYWILDWGLQDGSLLLRSWSLNFAIDIIQEIFFVQVVKISVLYIIAVFSIRPQLVEIRYQLHAIGLAFLQGFIPLRKYITTSTKDLFTVIQHISPTCRVAWQNKFESLIMSKILRNIDDSDMLSLRKSYDHRVFLITILFAALPIIIYFFGAIAGDITLSVALPVVSSGFVVANYYLYASFSITILLIPYIVVVGLTIWYFLAYKRTKEYFIRKSDKYAKKLNKLATKRSLRRQGKSKIRRSVSLLNECYQFLSIQFFKMIYVIALFLHPWMLINDFFQKEKNSKENTWCFMNFPSHLQPITTPARRRKKIGFPTSSLGSRFRSMSSASSDVGLLPKGDGGGGSGAATSAFFISRSDDSKIFDHIHRAVSNEFRVQNDVPKPYTQLGIIPDEESKVDDNGMTPPHLKNPLNITFREQRTKENTVEEEKEEKVQEDEEEDNFQLQNEEGFDYADFDETSNATPVISTIPDAIRALRSGNTKRILRYSHSLVQKATKNLPSSSTATGGSESHKKEKANQKFLDEQVYQDNYRQIMERIQQRPPDYLTNLLNSELLNTNPEDHLSIVSSANGAVSKGSDIYLYNYAEAWNEQRRKKSLLPKRRSEEKKEDEEGKDTSRELIIPPAVAEARQDKIRKKVRFIQPKFYSDDRRPQSFATIYQEQHVVLHDIPNAILHMVILYFQLLLPTRKDHELLAIAMMVNGNKFPILIEDAYYLLHRIWEVYYPFGEPLDAEEITEIIEEFQQYLTSQQGNVNMIRPVTPNVLGKSTNTKGFFFPPTPTSEEVPPSSLVAGKPGVELNPRTTMIEFSIFQQWFEQYLMKVMKYYHEITKEVYVDSQRDRFTQHSYYHYYYMNHQKKYAALSKRPSDSDQLPLHSPPSPASPLRRAGSDRGGGKGGGAGGRGGGDLNKKSSRTRGIVKEMNKQVEEETFRERKEQEKLDQVEKILRGEGLSSELFGNQVIEQSHSFKKPPRQSSKSTPAPTATEYDLDTTIVRRNYESFVAPASLTSLNDRFLQMSRDSESIPSDGKYFDQLNQAIQQRITSKSMSSDDAMLHGGGGKDFALSEGPESPLADYHEEDSLRRAAQQRRSSLRSSSASLKYSFNRKPDSDDEDHDDDGKEERSERKAEPARSLDITRLFRERGAFFFSSSGSPDRANRTNTNTILNANTMNTSPPSTSILLSPREENEKTLKSKKSVKYLTEEYIL